MNKIKYSPKISSLILWLSFVVMTISFILMNMKSLSILKNIDGYKKINHLQNFETSNEFEALINKVNPTQIENLLDFYHLDYFFMIGYLFFLSFLIYKIKYFWKTNFKFNSLTFHICHFILLVFVFSTFTLDVLENWQLIYQTEYFKFDLIISCFYYNRYLLKFILIAIVVLYIVVVLFFKIIMQLKIQLNNKKSIHSTSTLK